MISRLWQSAVVWSWGFNFLRIGSGILLLPLLYWKLSGPDWGFYWVLVSLTALVPLLDMGFLASFDRAIGYAMSGATELKAEGISKHNDDNSHSGPNYALLWNLLRAIQALYRILSLGVLLILGLWGTYVVSLRVSETSNPQWTWIAWGLTLLGGAVEMYAGWWNIFLRGLNQVLPCSRILVLSFALKFFMSALLLWGGMGLLSLPLSSFISSFLQRALSRRLTLKFLSVSPEPADSRKQTMQLIKTLWPNSWRTGCHYLSSYLTTNANTYVCMKHLGLSASGQYGLSLLVVQICQAMSLAWIQVKWPRIFQLRSRQELGELCAVARPRVILASITYLIIAVLAVLIGSLALDWLNQRPWIHSPKSLLPMTWLMVLLVNGFFEIQFSMWGTFILAENRIPYLWPVVASNIACVALVVLLINYSTIGIGVFVLGPLIAGGLFNYWFWPLFSARRLGTNLFGFILGTGPKTRDANEVPPSN